jgi:hypothetical protein
LKSVAGAKHEPTFFRRAYDLVHDRRKTRDGAATQIIAVGKTARQDDSIEARQRGRFMPDIFRP